MSSKKSTSPSHPVVCQLCSKLYTDPRLLPCLHSFCQQCLHNEIAKLCSQRSIQCPTCHLNISIPAGGVEAFPQNLHLGFEAEVFEYAAKMQGQSTIPCDCCINGINSPAVSFCSTCCEFLCVACKDFHRQVRRLLQHTVLGLDKESAELLPYILKPADYYCSQTGHSENRTKFYCEVCCCLVCYDCTISIHEGHKCVGVPAIAKVQREEMKEALQYTREVVTKLTCASDANKEVRVQVEASKKNCEFAINHAFEEIYNALEHRRKTLLSELEAIFLSKTTVLALQKEQFDKIQQNIDHHTEVITHILQTHTDHEVVALGGLVPAELKAVLTSVESVPLTPNTHSGFTMSVQNDHFVEELSKFGYVIDLTPSPSNSVWTSKCVAKTDKEYRMEVVTVGTMGEPYPYGGLKVEAMLKSEEVILGEVEDHGDGTYTITLTPQAAGPHQLLITMDGQHVQRSPYKLDVKLWDYRTLRDAQQAISVDKPRCVAVHENGDLYVGSEDSHIYVFNPAGHLKNTIGSRGSSNGQFESPRGIAIKGDTMYVADWGNHRVQKLTTQGKFLHKFGVMGSDSGQLKYPYTVIVDTNDRVIVSENSNHRIQIFSSDNTNTVLIIKGKDSGVPLQDFLIPWGLALDPQGNIHVTGHGSNTVQVFTPQGNYIKTYGAKHLSTPTGIAVDEEGCSLVCEWEGNRLTIFDVKGEKIHSITSGMSMPCGVSLSPDGSTLYVANFGNNNVLKYSM